MLYLDLNKFSEVTFSPLNNETIICHEIGLEMKSGLLLPGALASSLAAV